MTQISVHGPVNYKTVRPTYFGGTLYYMIWYPLIPLFLDKF